MYDEIPQIEEIFGNSSELDWDMSNQNENIPTLGDLYFGTLHMNNSKKFWGQFNLTEVFGLACSNIWAFYMAYDNNYKGFKKLCNRFWNHQTLDLRNIEIRDMETFYLLMKTFKKAKKIFLPVSVPQNLLNAVYAQSLIFYPSCRHPLLRVPYKLDYYYPQKMVKIVGELDSWSSDPAIDILLSFKKTKSLILRKIHFTDNTIAAMSTVMCKSLSIRKSKVDRSQNSNFVNQILRFKSLRKLNILVKSKNSEKEAMAECIMHLIKKIHLLNRLTNLKISLPLTMTNVRFVAKAVRKCPNITDLTIYGTQMKRSIPHYKILRILQRNNLNIQIRPFHRSISAWENQN